MEITPKLIDQFDQVWFPTDKLRQPFWFRAKQQRYRAAVLSLCQQFCAPVENVIARGAVHVIEIVVPNLNIRQAVILAIMMDQMPRNAFAVGRIAEVNDTTSLEFANWLWEKQLHVDCNDERVLCFFSLIFRHSNQFVRARSVLALLPPSPLVSLFLAETDKREESIDKII